MTQPTARAIVRPVSPLITACELTYRSREVIDVDRARQQHGAYVQCLEGLAVDVATAPAAPNLPDSVFVEDTAVVLDDLAIIARFDVASRQPETTAIARLLADDYEVVTIEPPGTLDGGDVLAIDDTLFVGHSTRTNVSGITQLHDFVEPLGYHVRPLRVGRCLHLKSGCSYIGDHTVLLNPRWVNAGPFEWFEVVETAPGEPGAANALWIADTLVVSASHPGTAEGLCKLGRKVQTVEISELEKAEGGVTCLALVMGDRGRA